MGEREWKEWDEWDDEWGRGIGVLFMVGGAECMGCGQGQGQGKGMARARAMTGRH